MFVYTQTFVYMIFGAKIVAAAVFLVTKPVLLRDLKLDDVHSIAKEATICGYLAKIWNG